MGHPVDSEHREFIDTSPTKPPPKPPKPLKPSKKSTNPFDNEEEQTTIIKTPIPTKINPLNPFYDDDVNQKKSLNPFDDDNDGNDNNISSSTPNSSKPSLSKNKSQNNKNGNQNSSTNPFDDNTNNNNSNNNNNQQQQLNRSPNFIHTLSSPSSMTSSYSLKSPKSPNSRSSLTRFTEHSPEYPDLILLLNLGFSPIPAYNSLMLYKDFNQTLISLRNDLFTALIQKSPPNWYPPILTRIGSWMPSQTNSSSRILYYIKVQLNHSDIAYVITKRYSEFVAFYKKLGPYLNKNSMYIVTPGTSTNSNTSVTTSTPVSQNVLIPFVDDRVRGYLLGTNEELCNKRQDMLHKWLSYLCLSERMMTDLQIHNLLVEFLQIETYVKRIPILTGISEKPVIIQIERTPREYL